MNFSDQLTKAGITNVYYESPGTAHEWLTWRRCFREFALRLFQSRHDAPSPQHGRRRSRRCSGSADVVDASRIEGEGPAGRLPLTPDMLRDEPSGNIFGLTQNAGMGWRPDALGGPQYVIVSTMGGLRSEQGEPIALGYHTGHWEIGLLVRGAAEALREAGAIPFAVYCSDPCDGRTQGTTGMFDSLAVPQRRGDRHAAADSIAADRVGRARHRHLRQGTAGDDAGAGRDERFARRDRARRRDAAGARCGGRRSGAEPWRAIRARPDQSRLRGDDGLPRVRIVRRRLPVSRDGGHVAGGRRSARPRAAAQRARAVGRTGMARAGAAARPRRCDGSTRAGSRSATSSRRPPSRTRCSCMRRSAARRTCCCTSRRLPPRPA